MLNVGKIENGIVIDHIEAGKSMDIYRYLGLGDLDCCVAIIKNARSNEMGRKDIIKIDGGLSDVNLDILGLIDTNITVNIIKNGEIAENHLCFTIDFLHFLYLIYTMLCYQQILPFSIVF